MQDIGILALLRELGEPYAKLLSGVIHQRSDLAALERDSLGFDHVELSAALMQQWHLPRAADRRHRRAETIGTLEADDLADADLARILHLAELMAQLVGQRRFAVLPELLEAGGAYRDLTKGRLARAGRETAAAGRAACRRACRVELPGDQNYIEVLTTAHERMSSLTEELAGQFRHHRSEDDVYTELLHEAQELTAAMKAFLEGKQQREVTAKPAPNWKQWHAPHERTQGERAAAETERRRRRRHRVAVGAPVGRRAALPCAAAGVEPDPGGNELSERARDRRQGCHLAVAAGARACVPGRMRRRSRHVLSITAVQLAAILPDCERRQAVALANEVLRQARRHRADEKTLRRRSTPRPISAGVATIAAVPKNFDPWRLVESAERCLYAARSCNTSAVKSIEI